MQRLCCALAISFAVTTATSASAETPRGKIYTRDTVSTVGGATYHNVTGQPLNNQFPSHGTTLNSTSPFITSGVPMLYNNGAFFQRPTAANTRVLPQVVVIERHVVEPAAVISRELAQQPVHPHLIEVFIFGEGQQGSSTIYLDPDVDYINQGYLKLDEGHSINRAQRLARSLRGRPGMIVYGSRQAAPEAKTSSVIKPHMIIEKNDNGFTAPLKLKAKTTEKLVRND